MAKGHEFRPRPAMAATALCAALAVGLSCAGGQAAVVQEVRVGFTPGDGGPDVLASDSVFAAASGDLADNILAEISGPGFAATASAGVFGQVGLDTSLFFSQPLGTTTLFSEVLVGSDEFVNLFAGPAAVTANFIIDGGFLHDLFSEDARATFRIEVGADHVGTTGSPLMTETNAATLAHFAASFGGAGGFFEGFFGGSYEVRLSSDADGNVSFSEFSIGGLDLNVTLDANTRRLDIPLSLQSLDLGVLPPGESLILGYRASLEIVVEGALEGYLAGFSDPFDLTGSSILNSITFTPLDAPIRVPEPGGLGLWAIGLAGLLLAVRRRSVQGSRAPASIAVESGADRGRQLLDIERFG